MVRPVVQEDDWFRAGDERRDALILEDFRQGFCAEIVTVGQHVSTSDGIEAFCCERAGDGDLRTILGVRNHAASARMHAGRERSPVYFGGGNVGAMVLVEKYTVGRERVEIGTILGRDEVRTHAVPHQDDHMLRLALGEGGAGA